MSDIGGRGGRLRERILRGALVAVIGTALAAVVMLPFREVLAGTAVGLVFVLPVVVATALTGVSGAVMGVISGFLVFNVFFTEPYRTVKVGDVSDVIALGAFVLVGAISSVTVALQHRAEAQAQHRANEAQTLLELSRSLISPGSLQTVLETVVSQVYGLFDLEASAALLVGENGELEIAAQQGRPPSMELLEQLRSWEEGRGTKKISAGWWVAPFRVEGSVTGFLVTSGAVAEDDLGVLRTFANQAALAVQRAQLAERATQAQVLEEADRMRTALIRSVSHDLRTPLSSIRAAADDLGDEQLALSDRDHAVLAETISEEAQRLDRLVENLLDMSRIEAGELSLKIDVIDLEELIRSVLARHTGPVRVALPDEQPLAAVDPVLMEQVLDNLVDNALQHGSAAEPPSVTVSRQAGRQVVSVVDHGPGIPETQRTRVFEAFHRLEAGRSVGGSGMGLAICRGYVQAHDGDIWVEETPGGGTTVVFTVPVPPTASASGSIGQRPT